MDEISWHSLSEEQVFKELESNEKGLSHEESSERLRKNGLNELVQKKRQSALSIFISQFENFLVVLLIIAVGISVFIGQIIDGAVIAIIIVINAILGFAQEYKAEKAIDALKKLSAPQAIVLRDGRRQKILAKNLVIGDIILLQEGDRIPAGAKLLEAFSLQVDESALTGESSPVNKEVGKFSEKCAIADQKNMVFMNTIITRGRGKAIVVTTGMNTQIGKVAKMIQSVEDKDTPLQKKLESVGKSIGVAVIVIAVAIFGLGFFRGGEIYDLLITSIALAVAAVPEGLPAIVTITLAIGLNRMARAKSLIRKLPAVETLGATNVICSDKTGTLTKNEMTVQNIFTDGKFVSVTGTGYLPSGKFFSEKKSVNVLTNKALNRVLTIGALCSTAQLDKNKRWEVFGDPTEGALIVSAHKAGIDKKKLLHEYKHIGEIPFDSVRKMMTVAYLSPTKKKIAYVKGAPEILLSKCTHIFREGSIKKITTKDKKDILTANKQMADNALRVLGMAYKTLPTKQEKFAPKTTENGLIFVGLQGMIDPPREEVKDAIALCKKAGIKSVMITGDHEATAVAIAKKLGILDGGKVLTGAELDKLSEREFFSEIKNISVYARVSPEHKVRILKTWQKKGAVVAMTGDGVNDAPALKNADIGVAMGIVGTDVAKEASAMVLQDDNFATIVKAVEEGRGIYDNIQSFIRYLISSNMGEVLTIFAASLLGFPLPLIAVQILWMNLLTDGIPALALGIDPPTRNIMSRPPRIQEKSTIDKNMWMFIMFVGVVIMMGTVGIFNKFMSSGVDYARTMAFSTIVMFQMWNVFNSRTKDSIFSKDFWNNKWLLLAVVSSIILQLVVIYTPVSQFFSTVALRAVDGLWILGVSFSIVISVEMYKFVKARLKK
ncbi:calcium-translocating P-type ATPase, SERCA-type [Candidatus Woesearchaeota archaeon]|jgi:P-type Ca2+ transporter type 2C|nr:calcium-translocating P-type ATPase, SERCA-type [Candidatus Woesearchaeota archaeon]MBT7062713.1 calcium-translocating P-type ATPase, SERCA-type [Candidatus Woesearchaeota archaeon]MBT7402863.1 calcium-translocating P-type ATPase, SERCA-type [Candidatus Woesearchaeota archaeon]